MRQAVVDYIKGLTLGTFKVSNELPFDASGQSLYLKNVKSIYVDQESTTQSPLINTLSGLNINAETTTVRVLVATDAKQKPSNYDSLVSNIKLARTGADITGCSSKECDVTTTYEEDKLLTEFEFRFTKLT